MRRDVNGLTTHTLLSYVVQSPVLSIKTVQIEIEMVKTATTSSRQPRRESGKQKSTQSAKRN